METVLSTKGQIVLPKKLRQQLGLRPGDRLEARVAGNEIILKPRHSARPRARIIKDPVTGWPVLYAPGAPPITNEDVARMLADFP